MYVSNATRLTYYWQTKARNYWDAEAFCTSLRGYLVQWTSQAKQTEVERVYTQRGLLNKAKVPFYWMGLKVAGQDVWPRFTWISNGRTPKQVGYERWGTWMPGKHLEPNNVFPAEDCAGANGTQAFGGTWGWADVNCYTVGQFICEVPFPAPPPPSPSPPYTSQQQWVTYVGKDAAKGSTYYWNPDDYTFGDASGLCKQLDGTLVAYGGLQEQLEVESAFAERGVILARTRSYWLGLRVPEEIPSFWPNFSWEDGTGGWQGSQRGWMMDVLMCTVTTSDACVVNVMHPKLERNVLSC
jgi:hypothetical protein